MDLQEQLGRMGQLIEHAVKNVPLFDKKVYEEAKKQFPLLRMGIGKSKTSGNSIYKYYTQGLDSNEGVYAEVQMKETLTVLKIEKTAKWLQEKGLVNFRESRSTISKYGDVNGTEVRVSDHPKPYNRRFKGINVIIQWNTPAQVVANQLQPILQIAKTKNPEQHISEATELFT